MTATGHAIIGTVIAAKVGNPALAVPIALASHVLADYFPHWDTGTNRKSKTKTRFWLDTILDVLIGFALCLFILRFIFPGTNLWYALFMVVIASSPDILTAPYLFLNWKFPPFSWAYNFQKLFDSKRGLPWGFMNQVAILAAIVILAKVI